MIRGFASKGRSRLAIFCILAVMALVLLPTTNASAHTPLFSKDNFDLQSAYTVNDPAKSWAIYATLPSGSQAAYFKFDMDAGGEILITLLSPQDPATSHFLPSFVLMIPGSSQNDPVPSYVQVPAGYGTLVVNGTDPGSATFEPFSPGWFYQLAELQINAPAGGTYYVAVYDPQGGGNYGLPIGYIEGYTIPQILSLPYDLQLVFAWEGQNTIIILLPMILALGIGIAFVYSSNTKGKGPQSNLSKWAAAIGGLAFIGYAGINIYQMVLALSKTGWVSEALLSILFIILPLVLGFLSLRYAMRVQVKTTLPYRLLLAIIGLIGLMLWTGLYIGPALLFLAALLPPYKVK